MAAALLLVFALGKVLSGLGNGSDAPTQKASTAAASTKQDTGDQPRGPAASQSPSAGDSPSASASASDSASVPAAPLATPDGDCKPSDITATPSVPQAQGGHATTINLALTGTSPACNFEVSAKSVAVQVSSGSDAIWSTQDCPAAIPSGNVVVRSAQPTVVPVQWSGRRADSDCQPGKWALPGYYHVAAAALGAQPTDAQFQIVYPQAGVVTQTATPSASPTAGSSHARGTKSTRPPHRH